MGDADLQALMKAVRESLDEKGADKDKMADTLDEVKAAVLESLDDVEGPSKDKLEAAMQNIDPDGFDDTLKGPVDKAIESLEKAKMSKEEIAGELEEVVETLEESLLQSEDKLKKEIQIQHDSPAPAQGKEKKEKEDPAKGKQKEKKEKKKEELDDPAKGKDKEKKEEKKKELDADLQALMKAVRESLGEKGADKDKMADTLDEVKAAVLESLDDVEGPSEDKLE